MGLTDTVILLAIVLTFNYLVLYKINRLLGNIIFIICGLATAYMGSDEALYGFIIVGIGLINTIYDILRPEKKSHKIPNRFI